VLVRRHAALSLQRNGRTLVMQSVKAIVMVMVRRYGFYTINAAVSSFSVTRGQRQRADCDGLHTETD